MEIIMGLLSPSAIAKAHKIAQKNAEELLGLAPDNTALDRAKALGFDVDNTYYHGTDRDFTSFNPNQSTRVSQMYGWKGDSGRGATYMTDDPDLANRYSASVFKTESDHPVSEIDGVKVTYENGRIIPLYKKGNLFDGKNPEHLKKIDEVLKKPEWKWHNNSFVNGSWDEMEKPHVQKIIQDAGFDGYKITETTPISRSKGSSNAIFNPANIRSKFAVFDPKKLGIGAGSVMSADLLANEINQAQANDKGLSKYGLLTSQEGDVLKESKPNPVLKYMADSYKYASDQGGLLGNILYEGGAKALDDLAYGSTPMQKYGRLKVPTPESTLNLMNLFQL